MANLVKIVVATMMMMILRVMMMIWITSYDDDYFALTIPSTSSPSDFSCSTALSTLAAWQSTPISWHWSPQPKYPKNHHIIKKKDHKNLHLPAAEHHASSMPAKVLCNCQPAWSRVSFAFCQISYKMSVFLVIPTYPIPSVEAVTTATFAVIFSEQWFLGGSGQWEWHWQWW